MHVCVCVSVCTHACMLEVRGAFTLTFETGFLIGMGLTLTVETGRLIGLELTTLDS